MDWKAIEREFAKILGTERNSKKNLGTGVPDIVVKLKLSNKEVDIAIEVKSRTDIPKYLTSMMEQAVKNAEGKMPVVILKQKNKRYKDAFVMLKFENFLDFFIQGGNDV